MAEGCLGGGDAVSVVCEFGGDEAPKVTQVDAWQRWVAVEVPACPVGEGVGSSWCDEVGAGEDQDVVDGYAGGECGFEHAVSSSCDEFGEVVVEPEVAVAERTGLCVTDLDAVPNDSVDGSVDADALVVEVDVAIAQGREFVASYANGGVEAVHEVCLGVVFGHVSEDGVDLLGGGCLGVSLWGAWWFGEAGDVALDVFASAAVLHDGTDLLMDFLDRRGAEVQQAGVVETVQVAGADVGWSHLPECRLDVTFVYELVGV